MSDGRICRGLLLFFYFSLVTFTAFTPIASASDTDITFTVTGSFVPGAVSFSPSSTITIDTTDGAIVSDDLVLTIPGAVFTGTPESDPQFSSNGFLFSDSNGDQLGIGILPLSGNLINYTGGPADGTLLTLDPAYLGVNLTGTLELSEAPEPASVFLFPTGLIIIAVFVLGIRRHRQPSV